MTEIGEITDYIQNKAGFDLVALDMIMPEMDGSELCRAIRKHDFGNYVYIILLTAKDSKNDIIEGLEAGADDVTFDDDLVEIFGEVETFKEISDRLKAADISPEEAELRYLVGPGVSAAAIWHLREALDREGFDQVGIVASSGFNPAKCKLMAEAQAPIDVIGTGGILAVVIFIVVAFVLGYFSGGSDPGTRSVLGLGTAQRNLSAALVVAADPVVVPAALEVGVPSFQE